MAIYGIIIPHVTTIRCMSIDSNEQQTKFAMGSRVIKIGCRALILGIGLIFGAMASANAANSVID